MRQWGRKKWGLTIGGFILLIGIGIVVPFKLALVFDYQNTNRLMCYINMEEGQLFQMKYLHSIHLTPVIETYEITEKRDIRQVELQYEDFAIGMPENASEGEVFAQVDGKYYIENMDNIFPYFDLRTGKVRANHTLIVKGKEYPLNHYIKPGTWVRVKISRLSLWQQWRGVNMSVQSI